MSDESKKQFNVPYPPLYVFEDYVPQEKRGAVESVTAQQSATFIIDSIDCPEHNADGIFANPRGAKYPMKGWPFPEAIHFTNSSKKTFLALVSTAGNIFKPIRLLESVLSQYNSSVMWQVSAYRYPIFLKPEYMCRSAREFRYFIAYFLQQMGVSIPVAQEFAKIFSNILQYDDAYRYRVQDVMSCTTKELLASNPRKEINRLLKIYLSRELAGRGVANKFIKITRIVSLLLLIPRVRKAFIATLQLSNVSNMQMDAGDEYNCLRRNDYNFNGETIQQRVDKLVKMHDNDIPEIIQVKDLTT